MGSIPCRAAIDGLATCRMVIRAEQQSEREREMLPLLEEVELNSINSSIASSRLASPMAENICIKPRHCSGY